MTGFKPNITIYSVMVLFLLSGCASVEMWKTGEPYQVQTFAGDPGPLAACTRDSLADGPGNYSVAHKPKEAEYYLSNSDALGGYVYWAAEFKKVGLGQTQVSTRGSGYLFGSIPPWSLKVMEAVKECALLK